jgi:hypothetical protein
MGEDDGKSSDDSDVDLTSDVMKVVQVCMTIPTKMISRVISPYIWDDGPIC